MIATLLLDWLRLRDGSSRGDRPPGPAIARFDWTAAAATPGSAASPAAVLETWAGLAAAPADGLPPMKLLGLYHRLRLGTR